MSQSPHLKIVPTPELSPAVSLSDFGAWYGDNCIISGISADIPARGVTCIVGPSGTGKSTLLRSLNRINDDSEGFTIRGTVTINGRDLAKDFPDITELRTKVGMVFQRPCVFPRSIQENVLFGVRGGKLTKVEKHTLVEHSLKSAALWDEVHTRLDQSAVNLSVGQQQRLCIARALAVKPDILLLDEPTASVDPVSARTIEALITELSAQFTIIMVTHNIPQARRIADYVMFMCDGKLMDSGPKESLFSNSAAQTTRTYLGEELCDC